MSSKEGTSSLPYRLNHLSTLLARQTDQVLLEQLGIGFSQYKIMQVLRDMPNIKQKQIATSLGQTEASVSRQIKLLIRKGLLVVRISRLNRREHITALTPKGQRFIIESQRIMTNYHRPVFESLSAKEQAHFAVILEKLTHRAYFSE